MRLQWHMTISLGLAACGDAPEVVALGSGSGIDVTSTETSTTATATGTATETTGPVKLDVAPDPVDLCKPGGLDGAVPCKEQGPPDAFMPTLQWMFTSDPVTNDTLNVQVIPLVGNFTDDNGDGEIDLCDTPDVLVVAGGTVESCALYVLDGATGAVHFSIPESERISCLSTPAFADIDADGIPEIVTLAESGPPGGFEGTGWRLRAYEHTGVRKWEAAEGGSHELAPTRRTNAIAIHDLDADGDAEIVVGNEVYDHTGAMLWDKYAPDNGTGSASFGADLNMDGDLEVVTNRGVFLHDGTVVFELQPTVSSLSLPAIANLDGDPMPELLYASTDGVFMVEHDGTVTWGPATPNGMTLLDPDTWQRPITIHDFDGDGAAQWAMGSDLSFCVHGGPDFEDTAWCATVSELSGAAGSTAFDFLGDGVAEAIYADERTLFVYDGQTGGELLSQTRCSRTYSEYPVVADVDGDASAEILVVSNHYPTCPSLVQGLHVYGDAEDRWIQARRIWNQHAYYVTNINEDGTLPREPVHNWPVLNTFRTNAQIEAGTVCIPEG